MKAWWVQPALLVLLFATGAPNLSQAQLIEPLYRFGAPAPARATEHDRAVAEAYRAEARALLQAGRTDHALEMLLVSLQYDSFHSDGHYELALHFLDHQSERDAGVLYLIRALENDSFRYGSYGHALYRAVWELMNLGHIETASETLEQFRLNELGQADLQALRARLALEMGEIREAERLAEQGMERFPHDPRFFTVLLDRGGQPAFRESRWIERERSSDPAYLTALLRYIEVLGDVGRRRALVEEYLRLGGSDPRVYLSGIDAGLSAGNMVAGFIELGGAEDSVLVREMAFALRGQGRDELIEELLEPLESFSGTLYGGGGRNGFFTEALELQDGRVLRYEGYPRGAATAQVVFSLDADGLPSYLEFHANGMRTRVWYRDYPVVEQVGVGPAAFEASSRRYSIIPDRVRVAALRIPTGVDSATPWPLRLPLPETESDEAWEIDLEDIRRHSYRLVESDPHSERVIAVNDLHNGLPLRRVVDESGDGRIDYILLYHNGVPVRAVRDLNSDGYFEQVELYAAGELIATAFDEDDSGMYLYLETLGENGAVYWNETGEPVRRSWEAEGGRAFSIDRFQYGAQPTEAQSIRTWAER